MAKYRDDLDAARLRMETLEAKLAERDAELSEREAALAARDAELAELKAEKERKGSSFFEPSEEQAKPQRSNRVWLLLAIVVIVAAAGAIGLVQFEASERAERAERKAAEEEELREYEETRETERAAREEERKAKLREMEDAEKRLTIAKEMAAARSAGESGDMGRLSVNCKPPSDVYVDGKRVGKTPIVDHSLPAGRHSVQCRAPEGQRVSSSVSVETGKTSTVVMGL